MSDMLASASNLQCETYTTESANAQLVEKSSHLLVAQFGSVDIEPTRSHDPPLEYESLERGRVRSKRMTESTSR